MACSRQSKPLSRACSPENPLGGLFDVAEGEGLNGGDGTAASRWVSEVSVVFSLNNW